MTPEQKLSALFAAEAPPARDLGFEARMAQAIALRRAWMTVAALVPWAVAAAAVLWALIPIVGPMAESLGRRWSPRPASWPGSRRPPSSPCRWPGASAAASGLRSARADESSAALRKFHLASRIRRAPSAPLVVRRPQRHASVRQENQELVR